MAACMAISAHSRTPWLISARRPLTGRRRPRTTSWCCASSTPSSTPKAWCHRAARLFAPPCVNTLRASVRQVALGHLTVKDTCALSISLPLFLPVALFRPFSVMDCCFRLALACARQVCAIAAPPASSRTGTPILVRTWLLMTGAFVSGRGHQCEQTFGV